MTGDDVVDRAVRAEAAKATSTVLVKDAHRRTALELAQGAQLLLDRANQFQTLAGHPQRFLVAVEDAKGDSRPPLAIVTP